MLEGLHSELWFEKDHASARPLSFTHTQSRVTMRIDIIVPCDSRSSCKGYFVCLLEFAARPRNFLPVVKLALHCEPGTIYLPEYRRHRQQSPLSVGYQLNVSWLEKVEQSIQILLPFSTSWPPTALCLFPEAQPNKRNKFMEFICMSLSKNTEMQNRYRPEKGRKKWTQKGENQGVLVLLVNFRVTHLLIHHLKLLRGPRIVAHELRTIFLQVILMQRRIRMRYGNDESFKLKIKNLKFKPYVCGN